MADRSNYADKPNDVGSWLQEHPITMGSYNRAFTPTSSEGEKPGIFGKLARDSLSGDWSWKPARDRSATIYGLFHTFLGVPPGGAELSHRAAA